MKKELTATLLMLATTAAYAQEKGLANDFYPYGYMGINLGSTSVTSNTGAQNFKFITAGVSLGYQFSKILAVEGLIVVPTTGKRDALISDLLGERVDAGYSAYGVYLNAKSPGPWFVKGRVGLVQSQFDYSADGFKDEKNSDLGLSYGVGGGYKNGKYGYELDYIVFPDVDDPIFSEESYGAKTITLSISFEF